MRAGAEVVRYSLVKRFRVAFCADLKGSGRKHAGLVRPIYMMALNHTTVISHAFVSIRVCVKFV